MKSSPLIARNYLSLGVPPPFFPIMAVLNALIKSSRTGLKDTVLEMLPQDQNRDFNPVLGALRLCAFVAE